MFQGLGSLAGDTPGAAAPWAAAQKLVAVLLAPPSHRNERSGVQGTSAGRGIKAISRSGIIPCSPPYKAIIPLFINPVEVGRSCRPGPFRQVLA